MLTRKQIDAKLEGIDLALAGGMPPDMQAFQVSSYREALETARQLGAMLRESTSLCCYRSTPEHDTCEDNCKVRYRYQEECPMWLTLMEYELLTLDDPS